MIFLDVEASGLHPTSYPVEVGWVSHDLLRGWSAAIWGELDWNAESAPAEVHADRVEPKTHRAEQDARHLAATYVGSLAPYSDLYPNLPMRYPWG